MLSFFMQWVSSNPLGYVIIIVIPTTTNQKIELNFWILKILFNFYIIFYFNKKN